MRVDPVRGSINSPQTLNRYAYVINDPVNHTDAVGLSTEIPNCGAGRHYVRGPDGVGGECVPDDPNSLLPGGGIMFPGDLPQPIPDPETPPPLIEIDTRDQVLENILNFVDALLLSNPGCQAFLAGQRDSSVLDVLARMRRDQKISIGDAGGYIAVSRCGPFGILCTSGMTNGTIVVDQAKFFGVIGWTFELGVSQKQAQMLIILHELGHATGAIPFDGWLGAGSSTQNTRDIFNACFRNQ